MGRSKFARFQILETLFILGIAKFSLPPTGETVLSVLYHVDG
jgi:hypothetical protein